MNDSTGATPIWQKQKKERKKEKEKIVMLGWKSLKFEKCISTTSEAPDSA